MKVNDFKLEHKSVKEKVIEVTEEGNNPKNIHEKMAAASEENGMSYFKAKFECKRLKRGW